MQILVTGGAGFVGSHLAEHLLSQGHHVVVLDDLSTGSADNIAHLLSHDRFEFIEGDILDRDLVFRLVAASQRVYHLAAAVGVRQVMANPVQALLVNTRGTENVLAAACAERVRVLITSSSEVYGKHTGTKLREDLDRVYGPTTIKRWGYAASKALDEFLALAYQEQYGLEVIIARLFNTVGPRQTGRYGMVVPTFVRQALTGQPITVYGTGRQRRSFTYVGDVVWAMHRLMECPAAVGQVVNIGNGKEISMLELARRIKEMTASDSEIVLIPYEEAYGPGYEDMPERSPDITKLTQLIDYRPMVDLDAILERVIAHERAALLHQRRAGAGSGSVT